MKNDPLRFLLVFACICGCSRAVGTVRPSGNDPEAVAPVRWARFDPAPVSGRLEDRVRTILLNSNKYALNKWYDQVKKLGAQSGEYLDFGGIREHHIRPVASEALALAVSLKFGVYDPAVTGVSETEAVAKAVRMTASLAVRHRVNAGDKGWGHEWQSALWASFAATAGWLLWDDLTPQDRELVRRMAVDEADRLIDYEVPYYRDANGKVVFKGDSKAEENSWNSTILVIAAAMMPEHPHWKGWYDKSVELQLSAYAAPQDLRSKRKINGSRLNEILRGSNVDAYGIVVNHNILHPDYMTAFMHNGYNAWIWRLAGLRMPRATVYNGDLLYRTLALRPVGDGRTMYVRGDKGEATPQIYYPEGNDWGYGRQANFLMMDVMAMAFGWDKGFDVPASAWADVRAQEMLRMQARDTTGQYYQQRQEDFYPSREEWVAYHAAFCYLGLWMKDRGLHRFTDRKIR